MGRALVVVESMFGNTEAVAGAVAAGIGSRMEVDVMHVADAPTVLDDDVQLLVVGGPTHAFGMSRAATRRSAVEQGAAAPGADRGIREWLGALVRVRHPVAAAAFDTRVRKRGIPGSAARGADKRLVALGLSRVTGPESFWVAGVPGPLADGELDRARRWGTHVAGAAGSRSDALAAEG